MASGTDQAYFSGTLFLAARAARETEVSDANEFASEGQMARWPSE